MKDICWRDGGRIGCLDEMDGIIIRLDVDSAFS